MFPTARSTLNWQNSNSVFRDKFATILHHLWNVSATCWCFLQLCRVPSPVGRSKGFCFVASFATCRLVSAYCGPFAVCRGYEFNTLKVEYGRDVSVNIVCLHSVDRTQKRLYFFSSFFVFLMLPSAAKVFIFLESPHDVFTAVLRWMWTGQNTETSR